MEFGVRMGRGRDNCWGGGAGVVVEVAGYGTVVYIWKLVSLMSTIAWAD